MYEPGIILNEIAQGLRPISEAVEWFEGLAADEQSAALRDVAGYCIQARATIEDGAESVRHSGIRPTHTPQPPAATRGRHRFHSAVASARVLPSHTSDTSTVICASDASRTAARNSTGSVSGDGRR